MLQLFTQTDKKLIPTLPRYAFEGRIIVVQSESEAQRAVNYLRRFNLVGLDTETRPSFRRGTGPGRPRGGRPGAGGAPGI